MSLYRERCARGLRGLVLVVLCALVGGPDATASVAGGPELDAPDVRLRVSNLRTTLHRCYWEFDWVIDNYGGVGAELTGRVARIVGRTDLGELPEWQRQVEMASRLEPWGQLVVADFARLESEQLGCAFEAVASFAFHDDRGLAFTVSASVSDRWEAPD